VAKNSGKIAAGIKDTSSKFATGANDTSGKQWEQLSITANNLK
jgi:hypothetical protein